MAFGFPSSSAYLHHFFFFFFLNVYNEKSSREERDHKSAYAVQTMPKNNGWRRGKEEANISYLIRHGKRKWSENFGKSRCVCPKKNPAAIHLISKIRRPFLQCLWSSCGSFSPPLTLSMKRGQEGGGGCLLAERCLGGRGEEEGAKEEGETFFLKQKATPGEKKGRRRKKNCVSMNINDIEEEPPPKKAGNFVYA